MTSAAALTNTLGETYARECDATLRAIGEAMNTRQARRAYAVTEAAHLYAKSLTTFGRGEHKLAFLMLDWARERVAR